MFYKNNMVTMVGRIPFFICFSFLCFLQIMQPQNSLANFETLKVLKASSFLKPDVLKGAHYTVDEKVNNDGILNTYSVKSSFGDFSVMRTSSLRVLIWEIEAVAAMKKIETDDTAMKSLKKSGANTVTGVKNLFNDPQGTMKSAAAGVNGLFNRAKGTVGKREATGAEDNRAAQLVGFSKSKGHIATEFGVNMYSRNEVLQVELDRLAWADFLGGLGVGVVTSAVPGVGGLVLTTSGTARLLNEAINTTPASELWLQNKNTLLAMGMNEGLIELFLNNPEFSPALQTVIVTALDSMKGVENRELCIQVALQASSPDMAGIITELAAMTAGYHKNIAPLKRIVPMARLARAEKEDGTIVVILPSDHIIWSEKIADITESLSVESEISNAPALEIWATGDLSEIARNKLEEKGWKVHTKTRSQLMPIGQ